MAMPPSTTEADIQDLAAHLDRYLKRVEAGETIKITREGKPIGRLGPVSENEMEQEVDPSIREKMEALEEKGILSWRGRKPTSRTPVAEVKGEKTVAQMLLEDRR